MKKIFTSYAAMLALSLPVCGLASTPFEIEENFDDDSHFTESQSVPDGWKMVNANGYNFKRETGSYFGCSTHSGSYIFAAASNYSALGGVLYTQMFALEGGTKCELEFWFYAPGGSPSSVKNSGIEVTAGTAQDVESQTIKVGTVANQGYSKWTKFVFSFVPETTGDYCFAFNFKGGAVDGTGTTALEDILISGFSPETGGGDEVDPSDLLPNDDNIEFCVEMPYTENFDGENYDGTSYLPIGWKTVGSVIWRTANVGDLPAVANDWYILTPESTEERDERVYTPFFDLDAGTEYTISFYTHLEGGDEQLGGSKASLRFNVGTEQDMDFQPLSLLSLEEHSNKGWERQQVTFTPVHAGPYCFAFVLDGPAYSGYAAIDAFKITAAGLVDRVVPAFVVNGLYDLMTSDLIAFDGCPVELINTSQNAVENVWEVEGATIKAHGERDARILFPESGSYEILLKAANERGERVARKRVNVSLVKGETDGIVPMNYNPTEDKKYDRGSIPTIGDDDTDYISGFTHFYRHVAEKFDMPTGVEFNLKNVAIWVTNLRYCATQESSKDQMSRPVVVSVYGADAEGSVDENKLFGRYETTMKAMYGISSQPTGYQIGVVFPETIKTSGAFFVAISYSDDMIVDIDNVDVGRSYVSHGVYRHGSGISTLYVKPHALPEGADAQLDGKWCPIDMLDPDLAGFGSNYSVWGSFAGEPVSVAMNQVGEIVFAARCDNNTLFVSGTRKGELVKVYNLAGSLLMVATADDNATTLDVNGLESGVYIVSCGVNSAKVVK